MQNPEGVNLLLRWHLSRIFERGGGDSDQNRTIHVTIHRSTEDPIGEIAAAGVPSLRVAEREHLSWWSRASVLEGWIQESTLIRSFMECNASDIGEATEPIEGRRLAEEMVLVQSLAADSSWPELVEQATRGTDLPELTQLAEIPGSRWVDITPAARRASKERYLRALGEAGEVEPEKGTGDAQQ